MEQQEMTQRVLEELAGIAFANATDLMAVTDGALVVKDTDLLSPRQRGAVASLEKTSAGIRVKFYDKLKALELLGKVCGIFDGQEPAAQRDNGLLQAIREATEKEVSMDEIPEIQQAAADRHDLVEPAGAEGV